MSHEKRHRGRHPKDTEQFKDSNLPAIREALADLCLLLSKGYAPPSSLKLVGDKFKLTDRQRLLLMRCCCTDQQKANRKRNELTPEQIQGREVFIDGFNLLITLESALSGGFIFIGVDGSYRDMSSIHGTYRRVQETRESIELTGTALQKMGAEKVAWLLDKPVSNSGRLRESLLEVAAHHKWNWDVELCASPDAELKRHDSLTVTSDGVILDAVSEWFNLSRYVIREHVPEAHCVDLSNN